MHISVWITAEEKKENWISGKLNKSLKENSVDKQGVPKNIKQDVFFAFHMCP